MSDGAPGEFASKDHLLADKVFHGADCVEPGDTYEIVGLGLVLLENGTWRIYTSHDALLDDHEDGGHSNFVNTIDPAQFPSTNDVYGYLSRLAAYIEHLENSGEEEEGTEEAAIPEYNRRDPGVH